MMKKTIIIDFDLLEEQNLHVDEFLVLVDITKNVLNYQEILLSLQSKQFIKIIDDQIIMREKTNLLMDLISVEKATPKKVVIKSSTKVTEEFRAFIEEYRMLWKGLKPGYMGSSSSCQLKMLKWMNDNPEYSMKDIMKAAKIYINSVDNLKYLHKANNFIYKMENGINNSTLSAFIDEIDNKPVSDWTTNLS